MENNEYNAEDVLNLEGENPEDNQDLDIFLGEESTDETAALLKKIATLEAQKEHWRTKATTPKQEQIKTNSSEDDRLAKMELRIEGYSPEEVEFISKTGSKDDPYVQAAIKAMRDEKRKQDATPGASNGSPVYKKYSEADLKNMSLEELQKIIPRD